MTDDLSGGLTLHVGDTLPALADALADHLDGPRADPFSSDLVMVSGPGPQRWLAQRLSGRLGAVAGDGVCAGIDFRTVRQVCDEALATAAGYDTRDDPWSGQRLVWALLRAFDASAGQVWFQPVAEHLAGGDELRPGRRYATAHRLAALYGRWLRWQPEVLEGWLGSGAGRGGGAPDLAGSWQARLWQVVADAVGAEDPFVRRRRGLQRLLSDPGVVPLPAAFHVFAPGRVSEGEIEVVAALARGRTGRVWATGVPAAGLGATLGAVRREQVAAWSRAAGGRVRVGAPPPAPATVLSALQQGAGQAFEGPDGSVVVHASHGAERQVEVLRDVLVDLLENDPTLEPRHIVVLTPDLDTYAPLVRARCSLVVPEVEIALHPVHEARVAVADRSLRQVNPVLDVLTRLLDLAGSRAEVAELLDLCATAPVARRFGFRDGDTDRLAQLMRGSGMRWGIDASTRRRRFGVTLPHNTWQMGLNRLLLGVTLSERDLVTVGGTVPYDLSESQEVGLLGSLAELAGRLRTAADEFATPAPPQVWVDRLRRALLGETDAEGVLVGGLVSVSAADAWQVASAQAQLSAMAESAGPHAPELSLGDVKVLVDEMLHSRQARSALLTGTLTVTSLEALPQVPHRVVVLLGLDEHSFPRPTLTEGDDILPRHPLEPDPALDDRQAFGDALLAAEERLVVIHRARDTRTNDLVPAPIPVRELEAAAARIGGLTRVSHSLQPYDVAGFAPGAPASYDTAAATGARALAWGRGPEALPPRDRTSSTGVPPADQPAEVTLDDLISFLKNPLTSFETTRLSVAALREEEVADQIPVELGGLDQWALRGRLLELRLAGHSQPAAEAAERLRGELPPGELGGVGLQKASAEVEAVLARSAAVRETPAVGIDVDVALRCGVRLTGRVPVHGDTVLQLVTGFPKGRDWVGLWVMLLAVAAAQPGSRWSGVLVDTRSIVRLNPPDGPAEVLDELVRLRIEGLNRVVHLPSSTAYAYARSKQPNGGKVDVAREWGFEKSRWHGRFPHLDDLLQAVGPDGPEFERLAMLVYEPIIRAVA